MRIFNTIVQYQNTEQKKLPQKKLKVFNFLGVFFRLKLKQPMRFCFNINNFFQHGFPNKTPLEIYQGFSDYVISNFLFQREFYQPGWVQHELPQRCFVKKVFLEISQNSHTCVKVCFLIKLKTYLFFIEHLWLLLLNMKSRHQQQQQQENSRKNLAA